MADKDKTDKQPRRKSASGSARGNSSKPKNDARKDDAVEQLGKVLDGFSKMSASGAEGVSPQITDALTQALLAILGSGPSMAAFDSLMSVQAANGMMYYNAVAHQQKSNMLGMAMTAKCVRYMLDPNASADMDEWTGAEE